MERRRELEDKDHRYLWHPFTQMEEWCDEEPLIIERGEGNWLIDAEGNRYLDGVSSLWANLHGHRRPEIDAAIRAQLDYIAHSTLLGLSHPSAIGLAERLVGIAPEGLTRAFYSDDGATAVEVALKMAFQYWQQHAGGRFREKTRFAYLASAYHGDTIGAVGVGGITLFHQLYRPLLFDALRLPAAYDERDRAMTLIQIEQVLAREADRLAALIMEPLIQGAAGMRIYPAGFTERVWELCRRYNILFIADEVATGFGRTGTMFACEQEGVRPDFLCVAKGLTGGYLPLAVTLTTEEVFRAFLGPTAEQRTFFHGHTYTGNPLGCAAALASLEIFVQEGTLTRLRSTIPYLAAALKPFRDLRHVGEIRQLGLMAGIELVADVAEKHPYPVERRIGHQVSRAARRYGVILRPLGDVIVLMPPLSIRPEEIDHLVGALYRAIEAVTEGPGNA